MDSGLAMRPTVHGMLSGFPLCRFSLDKPANWPDGHEWVESDKIDFITCARCRSEAEMMLANKAVLA